MWMKSRFAFTLSLLALLLASCAPATATQAPTQPAAPAIISQPTSTPSTIPQPTETVPATQAPAPTVIPIVTSRGPNLEATDPQTVSMASGSLQLVEFFEFW